MEFIRGNRAILEHAPDGKDLHLFQNAGAGMVQYVGQKVCAGYKTRQAPDLGGQMRESIVFQLLPTEGAGADAAPEDQQQVLSGLWTMPMDQLKDLASRKAAISDDPKVAKRNVYERSEAVRVFVLRRAGDTCEGCEAKAPFITADGRPYLEPHHIRRRSDGGPDNPAWVAGVCPNCHRRAHHSGDAIDFNARLLATVVGKTN